MGLECDGSIQAIILSDSSTIVNQLTARKRIWGCCIAVAMIYGKIKWQERQKMPPKHESVSAKYSDAIMSVPSRDGETLGGLEAEAKEGSGLLRCERSSPSDVPEAAECMG
jgi:hypothetical protein